VIERHNKIMWTRKPKYTTPSGVSLLQARRGVPPAFGKWELIKLVSSFFLSMEPIANSVIESRGFDADGYFVSVVQYQLRVIGVDMNEEEFVLVEEGVRA